MTLQINFDNEIFHYCSCKNNYNIIFYKLIKFTNISILQNSIIFYINLSLIIVKFLNNLIIIYFLYNHSSSSL